MAPRNPRSRAVPRSAAPALLAVVALLAGLMGGAAAIDCLGCTTASCYCSKIGTSSPLANPFDTSCANYLQCANGVAYVTNCPTGLAWNDRAKNCDWAANKMCEGCTGTTTTVTPPPSDTTTPPSTGTTTPPSTGTTTACNGCSDAACFCTKVPVGDYANPFDANCASYIKCYNGGGQLNPCPAGTVYDPALKICNWPSATNPCKPACTTGTSTPPTNPTTPPTTPPPTTPPTTNTTNTITTPPPANPMLPSGPLLVGYFSTWTSAWKSVGADMDLAKIPSYVNVVMVSFAMPDCTYAKGSYNLLGTGLQFTSAGAVVRSAIATLKSRQPNTRVMLAVGGATYQNFAGLNVQCIKDLVTDFGFDGVDLDWEPASPNCASSGGKATCPTDADSINAVTLLRAAFPKGQYLLSAATFHVGVYGEGAYAASKPVSPYTGINLAMAKTPAGQALDLINVMSYDAGNLQTTGFDPKESLRAHRAAWPSAAIALGVEVPPEAWGGNVVTLAQVDELAAYTKTAGGSGLMLWSLEKKGPPSAQDIVTRACTALGMAGCTAPLPM